MPLSVLELVQGKDLVQKEHRLKKLLSDTKEAIQTNDIKYLKPTDREKRVLSVIFSSLGLPYKDVGVNGFLVGYDQDVIDKEASKI